MRLTIIRTAILTFALIAAPHVSADFEAGQRALDAGNAAGAVARWQEAANEGDGRAMLELGRLYLQGLGVIQDYIEAHKWFNLAASRGVADALEERDALAVKMTPAQLATAQQMAAVWQSSGTPDSMQQADTSQPPAQAIREAQALLATLGYDPGQADGVWGGRTAEAYRAFLNDAGLPQTDTLTPQSLRAMQSIAARQGATQAGTGTTGAETAPAVPSQASAPAQPQIRPDALHNAAQAGDIGMLTAAIAAGVDLNARDSRGRTALMQAVDKGYVLLVSELLDAQADVNVRAPDGATALFMAAVHGHTEIIELLMKAGAEVSVRGPKGETPVEVAIRRYGEANTARGNGEPPAVLALLDGKTWAQMEEELEQRERAREHAEAMIRQLGISIEMLPIPGGRFRMGDLSGEGDDDERPVHTVTVPAFKMGRHEVTFAQWDACVADGGCDGYTPDDEGWGRGDHPVIHVSWDDIQSFIRWLNGRTGGKFRLPTEAEWEYAARAGTKTKYSWGNDIGTNRANCDSYCGDSYPYTAPVGSFPANPWGLHDLHGNVWEWVQDCWNNSYRGAPTNGSAWTSGDCSPRVIRGGAWDNYPGSLRSAGRNRNDRTDRDNDIGFRLAQDQ